MTHNTGDYREDYIKNENQINLEDKLDYRENYIKHENHIDLEDELYYLVEFFSEMNI